jgi:hypothetical protein
LEAEQRRAIKMLLLHQTGSVKVGEVVRYVVGWTVSTRRGSFQDVGRSAKTTYAGTQ